jgi:hypothetical protein
VSTPTCYFTYDPTVPGQPTVEDADGVDCQTPDADVSYTVGTPATFEISKNTNGATPGSYRYQLNGAAPLTQVAKSSGAVNIKIAPSRGTNILTVTALSPTGNIGDSYTCDFNAAATTSVDKNLTGSGVPDLLTVGGTGTSLAPGLWLDAGLGSTGAVSQTATDIGINGNGVGSSSGVDRSAADFTGEQAITGEFTADGLQDVLTYDPSVGDGQVLTAPGDGSALQADSGNEATITAGQLSDANGYNPNQLANAYNAASSALAYPDLIGTVGSGTSSYLAYYPNGDAPASYANLATIGTYDTASGVATALASPDGTAWSEWTITTAQVPTSTGTAVDMYLWNTVDDALYVWTDFTITAAYDTQSGTAVSCTTKYIQGSDPFTCVANYNQYEVDSDFTPGTGSTLEAAYFDTASGTDLPDLWAVTPAGAVTPYLLTAVSSTGSTFTPEYASSSDTPYPIDTADHTWALNDDSNAGDTVENTTARDTTSGTAMNLAATAGPTWATGSLFKPDVAFDGTGYLNTTSTSPVTPSDSFTVSMWVKPTASGGVVLSESGKDDSLFLLYPDGSQWEFGINNSSTTSWSYDGAKGGSYTLDSWTHLMLTYDDSDQVLSLYQNGSLIGDVKATNVPAASYDGELLIGADQNAGTTGSAPFTGEIADVQTWDSTTLTPAQNYSPPSYHQAVVPERLLDTRSTTGDTLTDSTTSASTAVQPDSTTILDIAGDTVTPAASGGPTTIPSSVTAVAVDITAASETELGYLVAYADGTQQPVTSATNYAASTTVTGYEIVPVGADGKIAIYNSSTGTTHLIIDITGYYTSDATLTGDQTYHPLTPAYRALDTATSTTHTNLTSTGNVAAGKSFTLQITGVDAIPTDATAVAINLTAFGDTGLGILEAYQTGITQPTDTTLTYDGGQIASLAADVSIGTSGTITINNSTSSTDIIGDISGYFTTDTSGKVYHTTNPTRIVDTRIGIGGTTGALASNGTYTVKQSVVDEITTTPNPTLALMLTATQGTTNGVIDAYPGGTTAPTASNLNWTTDQDIANLALTPTGTTTGTIAVTNQDTGTVQLVIDSSGYFANS